MARLYTGGAELGHAQADGLIVNGAPTIDTGVVRTGAASFKAAAINVYHQRTFVGVLDRTYFFRSYFRIPSAPTGLHRPFTINTTTGAIILQLEMVNGTNVLRLLNSANATIATGTIPLSANTWYRIEVSLNVATAGNSTVEVRINGVSDMSGSFALGNVAPMQFRFGVTGGNIGGLAAVYHDDVAINDDQGADQNTWPGVGSVYALMGAADPGTGTNTANWTKPGGATTNRHTSVGKPLVYQADSTLVADADKFVRNPTNAASQLEIDLTDYTTAGVPSGETITLVQPVAGTGSASATDTTGSIECLSNPVVSSFALTTFDNTVASATATTWPRASGNVVYLPTVTRGTQPRVRLSRAAANRTVMCNMLALLVETAPSTAWTRTPADGFALTDLATPVKPGGYTRTPADTLVLTDTKLFSRAKVIVETLGLTDLLAHSGLGGALPALLPPSTAAIKYVSPTGNDSTGDGSAGNPWASLQKLLDTLTSGQRGEMASGIYYAPTGTRHTLNARSGTLSAPIEIYAAPGATVQIRPALASGTDALIVTGAASFWRFRNLIFEFSETGSNHTPCWFSSTGGGCTDIEMWNCTFRYPKQGTCTFVAEDCQRIYYINCDAHDSYDTVVPTQQHHGFYITGNDCMALNCLSYNHEGYGFQNRTNDADGPNHVIYAHNVAYNCKGIATPAAEYAGFATESLADDCQFWNNIAYDNRNGFRAIGSGTPSPVNLVRKNIAYANDSTQYGRATSPVSSVGFDYDGAGNNVGPGDNLTSDPLLADPAGLDFRLLTGSPAIGAGNPNFTPAFDHDNNPRTQSDIGAFAYGAAQDHTLSLGDLLGLTDRVTVAADSLTFDGVDDYILTSVGGANIPAPLTVASFVKRVGTAEAGIIAIGSLGFRLKVAADDTLLFQGSSGGSAVQSSAITLDSADGWALVAVSKQAGTSAVHFHKFAGGSWQHETGPSMADWTLSSPPVINHGLVEDGFGYHYWNGNLLISAVWDTYLDDAALEALGLENGYQEWIDAGPVEGWRFDQTTSLAAFGTTGTSDYEGHSGVTVEQDSPGGWDDVLVEQSDFLRVIALRL